MYTDTYKSQKFIHIHAFMSEQSSEIWFLTQITMTLFEEPVVSPSGETYSKATVARFDNGLRVFVWHTYMKRWHDTAGSKTIRAYFDNGFEWVIQKQKNILYYCEFSLSHIFSVNLAFKEKENDGRGGVRFDHIVFIASCYTYDWVCEPIWMSHGTFVLASCCTSKWFMTHATWLWHDSSEDIRDSVCCSVLQYVAVCCSVLQRVAACCIDLCYTTHLKTSETQCVAVCCSVLQCVAVCCSVLQCVAVCCSVLHRLMLHDSSKDMRDPWNMMHDTWDMAHVQHGATWLIHMWDMTHSYVRHDSFICAAWLIHMCDMTHETQRTYSTVRHDSFIWETWLFICATWLIHICGMTHSYVRHDS